MTTKFGITTTLVYQRSFSVITYCINTNLSSIWFDFQYIRLCGHSRGIWWHSADRWKLTRWYATGWGNGSKLQVGDHCILYIMTSLNGNIFCVTIPLCREFTGHWWISLTKASDAELWCFLHLNKQLNKQPLRRWFETPWRSSWRHCNAKSFIHTSKAKLLRLLEPLNNPFSGNSMLSESFVPMAWTKSLIKHQFLTITSSLRLPLLLRLSKVK